MKWLLPFVLLLNLYIKADDLWDRAVKILDESKDLIPEIIQTESTMLNMENEIKNQSLSIHKYYLDENGEIKAEAVKILRDGKDITNKYKEDLKKEEEKEKRKGKNENSSFSTDDFDVFSLINQEKIKIQRIGSEKIEGVEFAIYKFSYKMDEKIKNNGLAYLNSENGRPLKVIFTMDPLPKYTKELKTTLIYDEENGKIILRKMEIEGIGSFLFYKRKFKIKTEFSNYFKPKIQ